MVNKFLTPQNIHSLKWLSNTIFYLTEQTIILFHFKGQNKHNDNDLYLIEKHIHWNYMLLNIYYL